MITGIHHTYKKSMVKQINQVALATSMTTNNIRPKINLLDLNRQQLQAFFITLQEPPFRAHQLMKWIYHDYCDDFHQMTNLNKTLRMKLQALAEIQAPKIVTEQISVDGTIKWSLQVGQQHIEMVYLPENNRATICISSQVGCALQCTFCSTAQQGFNRNLRVSEIIGQVWRAAKMIKGRKKSSLPPITNVVMMGMGEPLLNLANIIPAIEIMRDNFGFRLSKRHIIVSTSGIVPALEKLANMIDVALAISLHAPNNMLRDQIVPINRKYNIETVLTAVKQYLKNSYANHGRVTVEYVMLNHINDEIKHAHQLADCLKNIPCKINLIPWNSFVGSPYERSSNSRIERFAKILLTYCFPTSVRQTRGADINAACGQLVGKVLKRRTTPNLN